MNNQPLTRVIRWITNCWNNNHTRLPDHRYAEGHLLAYAPLAVVSRARKTLRVSTTATLAQIPAVSLKEGAVIGAVVRL
jgi:hypothetical protein